MAKNKLRKNKTPIKGPYYFGSGKIRFSEREKKNLSPETKIMNIEMSFAEALKLHLAIGDCLTQLNRYKRRARPERVLLLAVRISSKFPHITVHDRKATVGAGRGSV